MKEMMKEITKYLAKHSIRETVKRTGKSKDTILKIVHNPDKVKRKTIEEVYQKIKIESVNEST